MTVYVETDVLIALVNPDDPYSENAERTVSEYDVVTSPLAYLELLSDIDRNNFDAVRLVAHLLDLVPVATEEEEQIVLKAANYYDEGMSPFEAFHAATAETREYVVISSNEGHETLGPAREALGNI